MSTEKSWNLASFGRQFRKILLQQDINSAGWTGFVTLQPWLDTLNTNRGIESTNFIYRNLTKYYVLNWELLTWLWKLCLHSSTHVSSGTISS